MWALRVLYIFLLLFTISCTTKNYPPPHLPSSKIVKSRLYDTYSPDQISDSIVYGELDNSIMEKVIHSANFTHEEVIWKGYFVASLTFSTGKVVYIKISYYGGFFAIFGSEGFFTTDGEIREVFDKEIDRVFQDKIKPYRTENKREKENYYYQLRDRLDRGLDKFR